jgi:hypothetical protein
MSRWISFSLETKSRRRLKNQRRARIFVWKAMSFTGGTISS